LSGHRKGNTTNVRPVLELSMFSSEGAYNDVNRLRAFYHRLVQRQKALIEMGMIQSVDDIPVFAQSLYVCPTVIRVIIAHLNVATL
jgi:hypothetical protein